MTCFSIFHFFFFWVLQCQLNTPKSIVWLISLCSTSGSIAVFASLSTIAPQSMFVWVRIYYQQHLVEDSICYVPSIKTAVMMNFAPPAKKCSSRTLSPTPGAALQIGSPQYSTLCYSLCHIAQAKSSGGEEIWGAASKVSEIRPKLTWVFNQPSRRVCVCVLFFTQGESYISYTVKMIPWQKHKGRHFVL